ncbi:MAG TPA: hypothetical protein PLU17_09200 [Chitinophagaceae bacterium]|jgi:hypothetical protein|nr:hypothetical protein [Chitinophagaceae bacterium]
MKKDQLQESFNDFKLLSKTEMKNLVGGGTSVWSQIYGDDSTGAVLDLCKWTVKVQTSSNDCEE